MPRAGFPHRVRDIRKEVHWRIERHSRVHGKEQGHSEVCDSSGTDKYFANSIAKMTQTRFDILVSRILDKIIRIEFAIDRLENSAPWRYNNKDNMIKFFRHSLRVWNKRLDTIQAKQLLTF